MSEPRLPDDILALLAHEQQRADVSIDTMARAEARIEAAIAAGATAHSPQEPAAVDATRSPSLLARVAAKPMLAGAVLLAVGGAVGAGLHAQLAAPRVVYVDNVVVVSREAQPPPKANGTTIAPSTSSTLLTDAPSATPPRAASTIARAQSLALERLLLEEARTALARGDGTSAMAAVNRHAMKFPRGALGEEREAMAVQALVATGRLSDAKERAARFHKFFPNSMLSAMVDAATKP
jgi:hypothetical protein